MSLNSGLKHLPIEYISVDNTIPLAVLVLGFLQVCLYMMLDWDNKVYSFLLGSKSSTSSKQGKSSDVHLKNVSGAAGEEKKKNKNQDSELLLRKKQQLSFRVKKDDESIRGEDVELVFRSLGFSDHVNDGEEIFNERFDCNDLLNLFEEKEPSEEEVKATFDVFDENKDGFIDASELQRILCALGLREGREVENCRRMIRAFDENGDDRIDFNEFVRFMESSGF